MCPFGGAGERTREGNDLYYQIIESGVIDIIAIIGMDELC